MNYELKLQEDAFDRAEELAAELRIEETTALGCLAYLWRWATRVLRPRHDAPPDGIIRGRAAVIRLEAAARWKGARGALVSALERLQLITRQAKKLLVKGTKPYAEEWRKRAAARKRECERRRQRKLERTQAAPEKKPKLVRESLSAEATRLWHWMMSERATEKWKPGTDPFSTPRDIGIERHGITPDREAPLGFGKWVDSLISEGVPIRSIADAWTRYLGDQNFAQREWPVPVFMHENVYRARLSQQTA